MNKKDIDLINKIIELTKKIFKIYTYLYQLEINNKKETPLYQEYLNNLELLLDIENDYYQDIPISNIDFYIKYSNRANTFQYFTDYTLILNDYSDSFIYKRIFNKLFKIKTSNRIKIYQENIDELGKTYFDIDNIIYQTIHEDVLNSFLFEIEKTNNLDYQSELKRIKYIVSFLNQNIEKHLKYNFHISNNLYISNRILSDTFMVLEEDYQNILVNYYEKYISKELEHINNNHLLANDNYFEKFRLLLITCLIKAFNNVNENNYYLKSKIYDIISMNNIDIDLGDNKNIVLLRSEGLVLNGSSK